jgi:5-methylcytosine-specific restriction endonuclease McrA
MERNVLMKKPAAKKKPAKKKAATKAKRNYRKEYDNYQGTDKQKANRNARNKARRKVRDKLGKKDVRSIKGDVDHKKPIAKGGKNQSNNLRVVSKSKNRSFKRTAKARMK